VSLITGLEWTIAMEFLHEANEAALHYVLGSFVLTLSDLRKVSFVAGKAAS